MFISLFAGAATIVAALLARKVVLTVNEAQEGRPDGGATP